MSSRKQSLAPGTSRIRSNLLEQNVYIRDVTTKSSSGLVSSDTYFSLEERVVKDGIKQELVEYPYPITPASVDSYLESSDYRRDPLSALNSKPRGVNLGDIRSLQEFDSLDVASKQALFAQLREKFSSVGSEAPTPGSEAPIPGSGGNLNG